MTFRARGTKTFKIRVDHPDGRHSVLTSGCVVEADARAVERIVRAWQGREGKRYERLDVIDAIIEKRFTLPVAYDAQLNGTLDALLVQHPRVTTPVDLVPLIDQYVAEKERSGKGARQGTTYRKQLLNLFPERPFTLAMFTRAEVWKRLDALEVDSPTRNRYRTAASWLAKSLVRHEFLDRNFIRDIEGFGENDPRLVYFEMADARMLIAAMSQPYAAISALAAGFCMEWGAIERAQVADLTISTNPMTTPTTCRARGTKRAWRDRVVPLVPEWSWTLDYIRPVLSGKLPGAPIIGGIPEWRAIREQRAVASELKIGAVGEDEYGPHSLHDWRHTHTVALLRAGYAEQIAADHLGHKDTGLVRKIYGRFKATAFDYAKVAASRATAVGA